MQRDNTFFDRYKYSVRTDKVGGGSFGTVYKAYDNVLHRDVAIKVSEVKVINGKEFSLKDEFAAIKNLPKHPNIANYEELFTFETPNGIFDYAVMQFYKDGNLSAILKLGLNSAQKEHVAADLLKGVAFLHKNKVVHRDLKPSNILVVKHRNAIIPLITDFGLSKSINENDQSRFSNSIAGGTLKYSSPEQLRGAKRLKLNTDLWSYGAIIYEIFTGEKLFEGKNSESESAESQSEILDYILKRDLTPYIKQIPYNWQAIMTKCMVRDPDERIESALELLKILPILPELPQTSEQSSDDDTIYGEVIDLPSGEVPLNNSGANNDEITWKRVKIIGSAADCKDFIVKFPNSIYLAEAIDFLEKLESEQKNIEEQEWKKACAQNSLSSYNSFRNKFPDSRFNSEIALKISHLEAWAKANNENTFEAYNQYISKYPNGDFANEARIKSTKLKELSLWNTANAENSGESYKRYIVAYPQGIYSDIANQKIRQFADNEAWRNAKMHNNRNSYANYLAVFPEGAHKKEAFQAVRNIDEESDWRKTMQENKIESYEKFILNYSDGQFSNQAKKVIATLKDEEAWSKAIAKNSPTAFEQYLKETKYQGKYADKAQQKITSLNDDIYWNDAVKYDTEEKYQLYLSKTGNLGLHKADAEQKIQQFRDVALWKKLNNSKSINDYKTYLNTFPNGIYKNQAHSEIVRLEEENLFNSCKSISDFNSYISKYPKGKFINSANEEIENLKQIAIKKEAEFWQRTKKTATKESFNEYLKKYPSGEFSKEAFIKIAEINKKISARNKKIATYVSIAAVIAIILYIVIPTEEDYWNDAVEANTIEAYEEYLEKYPDGEWREDAVIKMYEIASFAKDFKTLELIYKNFYEFPVSSDAYNQLVLIAEEQFSILYSESINLFDKSLSELKQCIATGNYDYSNLVSNMILSASKLDNILSITYLSESKKDLAREQALKCDEVIRLQLDFEIKGRNGCSSDNCREIYDQKINELKRYENEK